MAEQYTNIDDVKAATLGKGSGSADFGRIA
jgi:hypothetical protein